MKVILIASNPKSNVPNDGYDLYVHFNEAAHFDKTPWEETVIAVRKAQKPVDAGSFNFCDNTNNAKYLMAVGWENDVRSLDKHIALINVAEVPYGKGKSPTSGMAAIYHFLNRGHEVTTCGFDLKLAPSFGNPSKHDWHGEIIMHKELLQAGKIKAI